MDRNKTAVDIFDKLARQYQDKFMDVKLYGDTFDLFCSSIQKEHPDILELACGPGNITSYLLKKRPDLRIFATDLSPNMLELAKTNNPSAEFQLMDCRNIGAIKKKYDGIMCGFCLPYLSQEETIRLLHDASELLLPGGILYLSTIEDDYDKSTYKKGSSGDEIFMHYYTADFLSTALKQNGFTIIALERKHYPAQDGTGITDLVIIAKK
jgi:trans-aconitate methyltransferase